MTPRSSPSAREHMAVWKWKCISLLSLLPPLGISTIAQKKTQTYSALVGKEFARKLSL